MDYVILIGLLAVIVSAFLALEVNQRISSIAWLIASMIFLGSLFLYVGALYIGVFQLMIYAGVLTALFAATANFLEQRVIDENTTAILEVDTSDKP